MRKSVRTLAAALTLSLCFLLAITSVYALSTLDSGNIISNNKDIVSFLRANGGTYDSCFDFEAGGVGFSSIDNHHDGYRGVATNGTNHYWQMFNDGKEFLDPENSIGHHYARIYANRSNDNFTFANFDYLTHDVDICADGYLTPEGDLLYPADFTVENDTGYLKSTADGEYILDSKGDNVTADSLDLSYINGTYFYMQFNFSYSERTAIGLTPAVDFAKEDGKWCARVTSYGSGGTILDKKSIRINEGVGVFNHITTVIAIDHENAKNVLMYFYLNVEYFATVAPFYTDSAGSTATTNMASLDLEYVGIVTSQYAYEKDPGTEFSMGFDNIAIHGYKKGYGGALSSFMSASPATRPYIPAMTFFTQVTTRCPIPTDPLQRPTRCNRRE